MSLLSPRLRKFGMVPSTPAPLNMKLLRSKSTSTIDTEILHSVRKVEKRVRNLGKRINKLPMKKSCGFDRSSQISVRIDELLLKQEFEELSSEYQQYRLASEAQAKELQEQCYSLKQSLTVAEKAMRDKDAIIEKLHAELDCQKALKGAYQSEAERHSAALHRYSQSRSNENQLLKRQVVALRSQKVTRQDELTTLKRDFRVLKGEFTKLTDLLQNE